MKQTDWFVCLSWISDKDSDDEAPKKVASPDASSDSDDDIPKKSTLKDSDDSDSDKDDKPKEVNASSSDDDDDNMGQTTKVRRLWKFS